MTDYGELLYQVVRFAFAGSLLLFLFLLLRATVKEIEAGARDRIDLGQLTGQVAQLHIVDGASSQLRAGEVIEIRRRVVVGRSPDCDIVAGDSSVSTVHGAVFASSDGWVVEDFGSTNGTYVSGRPVNGTATIENGETVQFGRVRMRLMC
ncbi:hypothetical protein BH24CHL4_BH24CHL4_02550 [soil metagenome]